VTVSSNLVWKDRRGYILSLKSALTVALIYSWPAPTCSDWLIITAISSFLSGTHSNYYGTQPFRAGLYFLLADKY
jgi:hypothetical protein